MTTLVAVALIRDGRLLLVRNQGQREWVLPSAECEGEGTIYNQANNLLLTKLGVILRETGGVETLEGEGLPGMGRILVHFCRVSRFDGAIAPDFWHEVSWVTPERLNIHPRTEVDAIFVQNLILAGGFGDTGEKAA